MVLVINNNRFLNTKYLISGHLPFMLSSCPPILTFFFIFKIIEKYLKATDGGYRTIKINNVWEVDRETEVRTRVSFVSCDTAD